MKTQKDIRETLMQFHLPRWNELSEIELYMDQLLALLNKHLAFLSFDDQPVVTKSMVNNYVKNSIIHRPEKKQYKAQHQAYLIVVMLLKPCFTMQEIGQMITIYSQLDSQNFPEDFNHFVEIYEHTLHEIMEYGCIKTSYYDNPTAPQHLMSSAIDSAVMHLYAQYQLKGFA